MAIPPQKAAPPAGAEQSPRGRDELAEECGRLEEELEALKAKYEMYFLGIERREPVRWREEVKKKVGRLKGAFTKNTGLRFRIQSLHARSLAYERLWLRAAREREEGTYRRDLFKARLHARATPSEDVDVSDLGAASAPAPAAMPAASPGRGGSGPGAVPRNRDSAPTSVGVGERDMRALYDEYVTAKRSCNEDVSRLTYEAMARSVAKQVPEILARSKAKSVEFKVVVANGRAVLKAVPKS